MELTTVICLLCFYAIVCGEPENIALGKVTSSSHVSQGASSERGNDGNNNTVWNAGSCVLAQGTTEDPYPWWQIDLEQQYDFQTIAITNVGNTRAFRLSNIAIKVYSADPTVNNGAESQLCTEYTGPAAAGGRIVLGCTLGTRGRYLRIQKYDMVPSGGQNDGLQFCEAEIFGSLYTMKKKCEANYQRHLSTRLNGPISESVETKEDCARKCLETPPCSGFDMAVMSGPGTCRLFADLEPVSDPAWVAYMLEFL